jgi:hypothetical protein
MSTRRAAQALVERRVERFESRHALEESQSRLKSQLAAARLAGHVAFTPQWVTEGNVTILVAGFAPSRATQRLLRLMSLSVVLLVAASAWAIFSPQPSTAMRYLLPIFTLLVLLGLPLATVGLGSHREAEEARIRKAIRVALLDEEVRLPPPQRWDDEEG